MDAIERYASKRERRKQEDDSPNLEREKGRRTQNRWTAFQLKERAASFNQNRKEIDDYELNREQR